MKMEREKLVLLVTAAQGGDAAALDELFSAFYNSVYYFALKTVEDEHTAADVTQETFIEVFSTLGKLKEPAAFVSWLKMITYHQCTRYFKKKKDIIVDEYEDGSSIFDTIADEDEEFLPDAALNQAELRATVMEMIDKLSAEQRAAVMMFYYDELSVKEIAKIQGVSENTVKSRLNYARQSIKRSVEAYEKRTGIKLRCAGVLPLLLWLFRGYFGGELSASAAAVAEGVSAATGTALSAASAASTASAASAASAATTAAAAKAVGVPLVAKIIAGIAAAVIAIGGASAAVLLSGDHVHAYTATVVREASCEADGEQKFTCECGESYTERLPAVSHGWGEWAQSKAPTYTALGEEARTCAVCSEKETRELAKLPLDKLFRWYPENIGDFAYFSSVDELSAEGVFIWAISHIDAISESKDFENYIFTYTYSIDTINARSTDYFGRTWEYSSITNPNPYDSTEYVYNAADNTVTVVYHGAFGDMPPEITYKGYTAVDETHFEIFYTESIYGESTNAVIKVELVGGDFVVTSHGRVECAHAWGDWAWEIDAMLGRDGVQKRTCSVCGGEESRISTDYAVENSFADSGLAWIVYTGGGDNAISGSSILYYLAYNYPRNEDPFILSADAAFDFLAERFELNDAIKAEMKQDYRYDAAADTFKLEDQGVAGSSSFCVIGYKNNGGNRYTVYYDYGEFDVEVGDIVSICCEVELIYNRLDGQPNKYLTVRRVSGVPDDAVKHEPQF